MGLSFGPPSSQVWESSLVPFGLQPPLCLCPPQVPGWDRWPRCRLSQTLNEFSAKNMYIYAYMSGARDRRRDPVLLRHTVRWHFIASDGLCLVFYQHISSPGFLFIRYHLGFSFTLQSAESSHLSLSDVSLLNLTLYVLRWPALLLCLPIPLILFLGSLYSWPLCHHLLPPPSPTATSKLSELQSSPLCSYRRDSNTLCLSWQSIMMLKTNKQIFFLKR